MYGDEILYGDGSLQIMHVLFRHYFWEMEINTAAAQNTFIWL
jgi:hypothetical protein